ncbi:MAG: hypothetical protein AAGL24_19525 [Pseudomonadota bacterium]
MKISDRDWDLLSAYADDALDVETRRGLERRLGREPELAAELERIRRSKSILRTMQPAPGRLRTRLHASPGSVRIAASFATLFCIVAVAVWLAGPSGREETVRTDWHGDFAGRTYVIRPGTGLTLAAGSGHGFSQAPDLSASRLVLVDVRVSGQGADETIALHYRGYRGCRLTLISEPLEAPTNPGAGYALVKAWETPYRRFSMIGDTMDPDRFRAIADYAEGQIRKLEAQERQRLAVADATNRARPC